MARSCDFSSFLRGAKARGHSDRQYVAVGVTVAKFVLKRRTKKFDTDDVKLKRGTGLHPVAARSWMVEFLSSWEAGHDVSHSRLADELLIHCPQLHERVLKYWNGY